MAPWRQRLAVFAVSLIVLVLEIALMRELAIRFWEHLAWLVISIALLGFGASGTLLVVLNRLSLLARPNLQLLALLGLALSIPLSLVIADSIDFNLIQMVWQPANIWTLGALELAWALPFLFGGMVVGLALEDAPERVPGHYAASLLGSGLGGIAALPLLSLLQPRPLLLAGGTTVLLIALLQVTDKKALACWTTAALLMPLLLWQVAPESKIADDKDLPQLLAMPGSAIVAERFSPQGRIEIVQAPAMHSAPGMALGSSKQVPPQLLITIDAQLAGAQYLPRDPADLAFLDDTTQALAYRLGPFDHALVLGDTGNDQVGLALYHQNSSVTALTTYAALVDLKTGEASTVADALYRHPGVKLIATSPRSFLRQSSELYSLIILPSTGTDAGGLTSTAPDSLLTLQTLRLCLDRLSGDGVLSVTTLAHQPPRESLRLLHLLASALREQGFEPARHIAMIRNWASVTIVASKRPLSPEQLHRIRNFCRQRGFDLVWLPDIDHAEVNRFHRLEQDDYYLGAGQLLGPRPDRFARDYLYDLRVPDDDRPFFHHFRRWQQADTLTELPGHRDRTFMELGTILLWAALGQALLLAFCLILLPLVPAIGLPERAGGRLPTLGFFTAIGFGFMLLEIGMLQRLTIYLAHPVYAAAIVLSGFLLFAGIGSFLSARLTAPLAKTHCLLTVAVAVVGMVLLLLSDTILAVGETLSFPLRIALALLLITPLTVLMGTVFPLGMQRLGEKQAQLVPWAWSVNGFASVLAILCGPILAMEWGFTLAGWLALGCYLLAAWCSLRLPD